MSEFCLHVNWVFVGMLVLTLFAGASIGILVAGWETFINKLRGRNE